MPEVKSEKKEKKEGDKMNLKKRIEKTNPDVLKKILLSHAQDHRQHLLSEIEGEPFPPPSCCIY